MQIDLRSFSLCLCLFILANCIPHDFTEGSNGESPLLPSVWGSVWARFLKPEKGESAFKDGLFYANGKHWQLV